jgi:hypothetical protein
MLLGSFVEAYDEMEDNDDTATIGPASPTYQSTYEGSPSPRMNEVYSTHAQPLMSQSPRTSPPGTDPFTTPRAIPRSQTNQAGYKSLNNGQPGGLQYPSAVNSSRNETKPFHSLNH